ncbi:axoneme-associated protein mst101(2)-like [Drosophila miranda]|uniref:axoneme-associated protein mst101(2)-like n=1 Tax=Drosophila miranda TaxID=7229 RepID=UPI00143FA4CC|nr:axoneme-associated protein mst101(2)-like [Drosophila miranda]
MRGLDKTPLWLQEPPAFKGGVCTKEGGAKPVPKYSFPNFICNSEETRTTELTPKPLTEQKDEPPAPAACLSSSNVAMRNREEKFEITKSHWSQLKEPRPSKQFEDDFDNLRQWQKSQSTSKLQQGYVQKQQQQQEQDLSRKCEAKRRDHLAAESRATARRPELLGEVRDDPKEAQVVCWPEKSCPHLKDNHMCTVKAKQAVERHQKANKNLRESCPIAAEKKAARRQQKHQEDMCKDTAKQREQQIFMLERKCKDILGEQAPQRGLGEELQLREVERLSKCLNLLELKMLLQMKSKFKRTQSGRTENGQKQLPQVKKCLEIWEKQELAEKGEERGIDSDCDGFVLHQIEEISKQCAATKEKYERRRRRRLESEARKKEEEERIRKEEAEAALRKKTAEALHRISLISDLKQKRRDIATKQQLLQLKHLERSMEEKLNEEKQRRRAERDQTRAEHKQRLRQMKRMV